MLIRKLILIVILLTAGLTTAQTGVTVTYYTGTTQNFSIETNGKLYFENEELYLKLNSTTTPTVIPVSIIQKITFSNTLGVTTFGQNENNLTLYPNPASDLIKIGANSNDVMEVKMYTLTGQLVQQGKYFPNEAIDISALSVGIYLIQANGITFKFVKK
ncbi:MAG: T9SS type A sorting domain-containing protein [Flavobacterium sp.]